jgi:hypothetical protein
MSWTDEAVCLAFRQFEDAFRRAFLTPHWDVLPTLSRAVVVAEVLASSPRAEVRALAAQMVDGVYLHTAARVGESRARDRMALGGSHAMVFLDTHRFRGAAGEEVTP